MATLAHVLHVVEPTAPSNSGCIERLTRLRGYRHSVATLGDSTESGAHSLGAGTWAAWRLVRLVRKLRPQIVHTHTPEAAWLQSAAAVAGVRARLHTAHHAATAALEPRALASLKRWRDFVHHYVADTRTIEKQLQQEVEPGRISQIYDAVDAGAQTPVRERHSAKPHYTVAARDDSAQLPVLHAWQRLFRDMPVIAEHAQLLLWLPEAQQTAAQRFIAEQGLRAVLLLPHGNEQFWHSAAGAHVFVEHCTRPDIAVEARAMRLGMPVIVCREAQSSAPADPSELLVPGQTGESLAANDPASIARALREFAQRPQKALAQGRAARLRLAQHFSLESMHNRYGALYETLLLRSGAATQLNSAHG